MSCHPAERFAFVLAGSAISAVAALAVLLYYRRRTKKGNEEDPTPAPSPGPPGSPRSAVPIGPPHRPRPIPPKNSIIGCSSFVNTTQRRSSDSDGSTISVVRLATTRQELINENDILRERMNHAETRWQEEKNLKNEAEARIAVLEDQLSNAEDNVTLYQDRVAEIERVNKKLSEENEMLSRLYEGAIMSLARAGMDHTPSAEAPRTLQDLQNGPRSRNTDQSRSTNTTHHLISSIRYLGRLNDELWRRALRAQTQVEELQRRAEETEDGLRAAKDSAQKAEERAMEEMTARIEAETRLAKLNAQFQDGYRIFEEVEEFFTRLSEELSNEVSSASGLHPAPSSSSDTSSPESSGSSSPITSERGDSPQPESHDVPSASENSGAPALSGSALSGQCPSSVDSTSTALFPKSGGPSPPSASSEADTLRLQAPDVGLGEHQGPSSVESSSDEEDVTTRLRVEM